MENILINIHAIDLMKSYVCSNALWDIRRIMHLSCTLQFNDRERINVKDYGRTDIDR